MNHRAAFGNVSNKQKPFLQRKLFQQEKTPGFFETKGSFPEKVSPAQNKDEKQKISKTRSDLTGTGAQVLKKEKNPKDSEIPANDHGEKFEPAGKSYDVEEDLKLSMQEINDNIEEALGEMIYNQPPNHMLDPDSEEKEIQKIVDEFSDIYCHYLSKLPKPKPMQVSVSSPDVLLDEIREKEFNNIPFLL